LGEQKNVKNYEYYQNPDPSGVPSGISPRRKPPGQTSYYACQIIRIVFIAIFAVEIYYCYLWLVQPLIPVIRNIIANNGVPSIGFSVPKDVMHPLTGISVAGMSGESALSLGLQTAIRAGIFGIVFPVTAKVRNIFLRVCSR